MTLFLLSLVPLLLGPLLVQALFKRPGLVPMLDAFVLISVGGIVTLHILPESIVHGGGLAAVAAFLGLLLPFFLERKLVNQDGYFSGIALLALVGLGIHGMLDGVALAAGDVGADNGYILALGVVIHRIPAGLAIWCFARSRQGMRGAFLVVAVLITFSGLGFGVSLAWSEIFKHSFWYVLQALLVGSLAHVLLHKSITPNDVDEKSGLQIASAVGAALGVALLFALDQFEAHDHAHAEGGTIGSTFMTLALGTAPPVLLGFALAGVMHTLAFDRIYHWIGSGGKLSQAFKGAVIGFPLNICSCAVLPVYRTLIAKRVSTHGALAFLISAPEIGITTIFLSISLLGWKMSLFRGGAALAMGIGVSLLANGVSAKTTAPDALLSIPPRYRCVGHTKERLVQGCRYGFETLLDHMLPWIVAGLGIAAVLAPMLSPNGLSQVPHWAQVPVAAVAGVPLYICATGSTPLAVLLMHKGFSAGGCLALLLSGPATNVATFGMLAKLHGKRFAFLTAIGIIGVSIALGYLFDFIAATNETFLHVHQMSDHDFGPISWAALGILSGLMVRSILRQGVRGFVDQILKLHGHEHGNKEVLAND